MVSQPREGSTGHKLFRTEQDFTGWPWQQGQTGNQLKPNIPRYSPVDTIESGEWRGHLGRGLAPKELQYVMSVAAGMTAKEIAQAFGISPDSVKKRLDVAMFKLGVRRRTALVAEAMKRQIISPVCILMMAVIATHAVIDDQSMRRDRRSPDRRTAQVRMVRSTDALRYCA
jgi:DNA-binding CsgD family transcriptional regulator